MDKSYANSTARECTQIEAIGNRVSDILEFANRLANVLGNCCERAEGPIPQQGEKAAGPRPVASGVVGTINERLDNINDMLRVCEVRAERLSTIV